MTGVIATIPKYQFSGATGNPLVNGTLDVYLAGTTTRTNTWKDQALTSQNTNPVVLDSRGECVLWLDSAVTYKFVLKNSVGVIQWTQDNLSPSGASDALKSALAASSGASLIGVYSQNLSQFLKSNNAIYVDNIAALRNIDVTKFTRVNVCGYYSSGDDGGGIFFPDLTDTTSLDNGGSIIVASDATRWKVGNARSMSVKQWGCRWNGTSDDTPRAQVAIDFFTANGGQLRFPASGSGWITSLTIRNSLYTVNLHNDGSYIEGIATASTLAIFNIVGCVDLSMTGAWRFNGANKNNYRAALAIRVDPATSQPTTRLKIYNVTVRNSPIGISNGEYNNDLQCSEIGIFGADFFQCPQPIYNGGSNSGMQLIGCDITSEANAAFTGVVETSIFQEGGFLKVTGGSVVCNPTASYCITQAPCQSALYSGNLYGTLDVVGAHVETNAPLINVQNPRAFSTTDSGYSSFKFIGNTGFAGGDISRDFGYVSDASYAGLIKIHGCNWYASAPRTGYNMSGVAPLARFDIDKTSLGKNFLNWLGGIRFGRAIHDMAPVTSVSGLGVTYTASTTNTLKFQIKNISNELAKYGAQYNPATGAFEVPPGGFATLQINCYIASSTSVTSGDLYLRRGGAIVAFGVLFGRVGTLNATLHDLVAGEILDIILLPIGGNFTADNGLYNSLQIVGETQ